MTMPVIPHKIACCAAATLLTILSALYPVRTIARNEVLIAEIAAVLRFNDPPEAIMLYGTASAAGSPFYTDIRIRSSGRVRESWYDSPSSSGGSAAAESSARWPPSADTTAAVSHSRERRGAPDWGIKRTRLVRPMPTMRKASA